MPPGISRETVQVRRELAAAATRVPAQLRRLRTRLGGLRFFLAPDGSLAATATIRASRSPGFSIAFSVARKAGRWTLTSISLPD